MNESAQKIIGKYIQLRDEIDNLCNSLHKLHIEHTLCKQGCHECCMNFRLLPIEFYSILFLVNNLKYLNLNNTDNESCPFLINHSCTIYQNRPIICRSHGLPILDMDLEGENWELSFCPLNFKRNDDEYFTHSNSYHQDTFNSKLYMLNLEFVKALDGIEYERDEMIEIKRFSDFI
jgi:uncharacterized protein